MLTTVAIAYLLLPLAIFSVGWLKLPLAVAMLAALLASLYLSYRCDRERTDERFVFGLRAFGCVLVVAAFWVAVSGQSGLVPQTWDYIKQNAIFRGLFENPWPVVASAQTTGREPLALVYGVAWQLPAVFVGKWTSLATADVTHALWTYAGFVLALLVFLRAIRRTSVAWQLFFILFGGLDYLGYVALQHQLPAMAHTEWWIGGGKLWQFSSNLMLTLWMPQHGIPQWLITGCLLDDLLVRRRADRTGLLLVAGMLWSPLTLLGMAVFAPLLLRRDVFRSAISPMNLLALPVLCVVLGYYASKSPYPLPHGWIWQSSWVQPDRKAHLLRYLLVFLTFEVGIYVLCAAAAIREFSRDWRVLLASAGAVLVLCPFYFVGWSNDFTMRVSGPSLYILSVACAYAFQSYARARRYGWAGALGLATAIGMFTSVREPMSLVQQVLSTRAYDLPEYGPGYYFRRDAVYTQFYSIRDSTVPDLKNQYIGSTDSFFFRRLARQQPDPQGQ